MKKLYLNLNKYLFNFNAEGGSGAGGSGSGSGAASGAAVAGEGAGAGSDAGKGATQAGGQGDAAQPQQGADWRSSLPEDIRGHESLKDVKSIEDLTKAFLAKAVGSKLPEKLVVPQGIPENLAKWGLEEAKLDQDQFNKVVAKHAELQKQQMTALVTAHKAGLDSLYKEWGAEKDANLQLANRVLNFADPDGKLEFVKFLKSPESGFAMMNPMIIRLFHNIGKSMKEGGVIKSENVPANVTGQKVNQAYDMYPEHAPKK